MYNACRITRHAIEYIFGADIAMFRCCLNVSVCTVHILNDCPSNVEKLAGIFVSLHMIFVCANPRAKKISRIFCHFIFQFEYWRLKHSRFGEWASVGAENVKVAFTPRC